MSVCVVDRPVCTEAALGVRGAWADHDRAGPNYRYLDCYATANLLGATWRRLRYKRHPNTTLRNLTLKNDFKRSMYQLFQFTGEYSLTNS